MLDLESLKIPIDQRLNGIPRPPTSSRAGNIPWLLNKINAFIDAVDVALDAVGAEANQSEAVIVLQSQIASIQSEIQQTLVQLAALQILVQSLTKIEQSFFEKEIPHYAAGSGSFELGARVRFLRAGTITAIRYFKPHTETGSHTGRIWNATGTLLTSVSFSSETGSNWQTQKLEPPFLVQPNTDYLVSVNSNSITPYGSTPFEDRSNNDLIAISAAYGETGNFPANSSPGANYCRDLEFIPTG